MRNIKLVCEYDGTAYHGFQRQKEDILTIQGVLEGKLSIITKERIVVTGSGRTDAGVHAKGQVANFKTTAKIPAGKFVPALNSLLPEDIVVKSAEEAEDKFHSRFDVKSKTYRYTILNHDTPSVFMRNYAYVIPYDLDIVLMKEAVTHFIGEHDFSAFSGSDTVTFSSVRNIIECKCIKCGKYIYITVTGDGFLNNMVRIIVGTLLEVGKGRFQPEDIKSILFSKDRKRAGPTVPAHGLCLIKVRY